MKRGGSTEVKRGGAKGEKVNDREAKKMTCVVRGHLPKLFFTAASHCDGSLTIDNG